MSLSEQQAAVRTCARLQAALQREGDRLGRTRAVAGLLAAAAEAVTATAESLPTGPIQLVGAPTGEGSVGQGDLADIIDAQLREWFKSLVVSAGSLAEPTPEAAAAASLTSLSGLAIAPAVARESVQRRACALSARLHACTARIRALSARVSAVAIEWEQWQADVVRTHALRTAVGEALARITETLSPNTNGGGPDTFWTELTTAESAAYAALTSLQLQDEHGAAVAQSRTQLQLAKLLELMHGERSRQLWRRECRQWWMENA